MFQAFHTLRSTGGSAPPRDHRPARFRQVAALLCLLLAGTFVPSGAIGAVAQAGGTIRGSVVLEATGEAIHNAVVQVVGTGKVATTDHDGRFEIADVAPGTYEVLAQRERLTAERRTVTVEAGATVELDFGLALRGVREEVVVTASPIGGTTAFDAFNAVTSLDSVDIAEDMAATLGELLEGQPGVAKRSFGPGNARPIIRGFDGDRVLIMQDGVRTGDLSSQSGDHGVSIDPGSLHRIEVVKGPATLLYGSNAIGGVVNAITPHEAHLDHRPEGVQGQVTTDGDSASAGAGGNASLQYGEGNWTVWAGGGGRRTGDYDTPEGEVDNSAIEMFNGRAGFGYFGERGFFSAGLTVEDGTFGIPFAGEFHGHAEEEEEEHGHDEGEEEEAEHEEGEHEEEELLIELEQQRRQLRLQGGVRNLQNRIVESVRAIFSFVDYQHDEIEVFPEEGEREVGTSFDNEIYVVRVEAQQKRAGRLSGQFGLWGKFRDYVATGEEALAPPTTQAALAAFAYEELDFGRFRLQFGGRIEYNDYDPEERALDTEHDEEEEGEEEGEHDHEEEEFEPRPARPRSFTGFSGSAGVHVDLGRDNAFVANFTRSYRAPSLEELYNFGPHVGNLTFEIGNPDLEREAALGLDLSLRHRSRGAQAEINFFYYDIDNFVFPAFTEDLDVVDGLLAAEFLQGNARHVGVDGRARVRLHRHLWGRGSIGWVDAELTDTGEALPRIPPLSGKLGLELVDLPWEGLSVRPEVRLIAGQDAVFRNETPTEGAATLDLQASYSLAQRHLVHVFSVKGYNLTDELYRNHTSFIKEFAPEVGRGFKASYSLQFF